MPGPLRQKAGSSLRAASTMLGGPSNWTRARAAFHPAQSTCLSSVDRNARASCRRAVNGHPGQRPAKPWHRPLQDGVQFVGDSRPVSSPWAFRSTRSLPSKPARLAVVTHCSIGTLSAQKANVAALAVASRAPPEAVIHRPLWSLQPSDPCHSPSAVNSRWAALCPLSGAQRPIGWR